MKDYNAFLKRGITYAYTAAENWGNRRWVLMDFWHKNKGTPKGDRAFKILIEIESRAAKIFGMIATQKEQAKEAAYHARHAPIIYTCPDFICSLNLSSVSRVIEAQDYDPDKKYLCPLCNEEMQCDADRFLDFIND